MNGCDPVTYASPATCHPDRPLRAHGRCNACYIRDKRAGVLTMQRRGMQLTPRHQFKFRMADCHPDRPHSANGRCVACYGRDMMRQRRADGRTTSAPYDRAARLRNLYGITEEDYDRMLAEQGGGCAVCGKAPDPGRFLDVDHDHKTDRVRGLLCRGCNRMLGIIEGPLFDALLAYRDNV
jgi:hypothetical protein